MALAIREGIIRHCPVRRRGSFSLVLGVKVCVKMRSVHPSLHFRHAAKLSLAVSALAPLLISCEVDPIEWMEGPFAPSEAASRFIFPRERAIRG